MADIFLIVGICIFLVILLVVAVYLLVYYQHPDDKNDAYIPKAVVIIGFVLAGMTVLMLPLDVSNNEGYAGCEGYDTAICGGINMNLMWDVVFWMIPAFVFVVIPMSTFYYEADDGMLMAGTSVNPNPIRKSRWATAICYEFVVLIIFGLLFALTYLFLNETYIPVKAYTAATVSEAVSSGTLFEAEPLDRPFTANDLADVGQSDLLLLVATEKLYPAPADETIVLSVDVATYYAGLMAWIGWFLFAIFGGIGMAALPLDWILKFTRRPRHMDAVEFADAKLSIQQRVNELVDIGEQLKIERDEKKARRASAGGGGWFNRAARKEARADTQTLREFKSAVYLLEQDVDDFQAYSSDVNAYNPLTPYIAFVAGFVCLIISAFWIVHIILYIMFKPPITPFLNNFFEWFDGWFPLLGVLFVALFIIYLLFCAMKGCFKFGLRFMLVDLHPMRPGRTYMSSFMFNIALVLLCTLPVVQFGQEAFSDYARFTTIRQIYGVQVENLRFFNVFWRNNVFIYMFFGFFWLTILYLIFRPGDKDAVNGLALRDRLKSRRA